MFRVQIKNANASQVWELPYDSWSFTEELNRDRSANVSLSHVHIQSVAEANGVTDEFILAGGYRELNILDDDTLLYAGYVAEVQFNQGEAKGETISLASKGFFSLLEKRYTDAYMFFDDTHDITEIIQALLDYTQGLDYGNLGITFTPITTRNMQRTFEYDNIKKELEGMTNNNIKNGIDLEVNNQKQMIPYYPFKGTQRPNIQLVDGFNFETYQAKKLFINSMANQVIVIGKGQDEERPVVIRDADDVYKENFFLLQEDLSETGVEVEAELANRGDRYLEENKVPRFVISGTCRFSNPLWTDYEVGDFLKVKIAKRGINSFLRATKRSLNNKGQVGISFAGT